jgi:hypothetical protein
MGNHKTRIAKLERQSDRSARFGGRLDLTRFAEAHSRGMVLCKDGIERQFDQWLQTLAPGLAEQISGLQTKQES